MIKILEKEFMVDLHLPFNVISKIFKDPEDEKNFKTILKEIDSEQKIDVYYDRQRLQDLFFNLNPQIFSKGKFRRIILESMFNTKKCLKFLESIGIKEDEITESNKEQVIIKASNFKWGPNIETRSFITNFELDESLIPSNFLDISSLEEFPPAHEPYTEMFDYQSEIFYESLNYLKKPNQRFIIQVPTGGGKTKIGMEIVCHELNSETNKKILWLADRKELCEQAIEAFEKIWKHKGRRKITLNRVWEGYELNPNIRGSSIIVSTIGKILEITRKKKFEINADIIIFDEAHHASAGKYRSAIIYSSKPGTKVFGLTATPGRSYKDIEDNQELSEMFDEEILEIKTPNNIGAITHLQNRGILSKPKIHPPIQIPKIKKIFTTTELKELAKKSDYSLKDLQKIGKDHIRNIIIIKKLIEVAETGKQILYFGTSVPQSRLMYAVMKHKGFLGVHIEADTLKEFRRDSISKFKNKKIQILFNNEVLATGFDAPSVDIVFIARPTKSPILLQQMIGRGMRGKNVGGTDEFDLYYVKDSIFAEFTDLDELFGLFREYFVKK